MLARDAHVARRNALLIFFQTFLQPLLFVFIFGRVMVSSGYMPEKYKSLLLPGIIAISMVFTGIWAVAMPLMPNSNGRAKSKIVCSPPSTFRGSPSKIVAGMLQALVAGVVVLPLGWLVLGRGLGLAVKSPIEFAVVMVLVAVFSAAGGLALGCTMNQQHVGLMFSMVITPMIFFGCTYYPWSALNTFPILQKIVLINPLVYASEGLRGALVPQYPHLSAIAVLIALSVFDLLLLLAGLHQFQKKSVS